MKYTVFLTALVLPWMAFSEVKCGTCNGKGYCYNTCLMCNGKGFIQSDSQISRRGRLKTVLKKCPTCNDGTLKCVRGKTKIFCQDCLGTGKVGGVAGEVRPGGGKGIMSLFGLGLDEILKKGIGDKRHQIQTGYGSIVFFKMRGTFAGLRIGAFSFGPNGLFQMRFISESVMDGPEKQDARNALLKKFAAMGFDESTNLMRTGEGMKPGRRFGNNYYRNGRFYIGIGMHEKWLFCDFADERIAPKECKVDYYEFDNVMSIILDK